MNFIDVKSSNVARVGYDRDARVLAVVFRTPGGEPAADEYRYAGVPPVVADALTGEAARARAGYPGASVGRAFNALVKTAGFVCTRVRPVEPPTPAAPTAPADLVDKYLAANLGARRELARLAAELAWRLRDRGVGLEAALASVDELVLAHAPPAPSDRVSAAPPTAFDLAADAIREG